MESKLSLQLNIIKRGIENLIDENELRFKISNSIRNNEPLKIKLGVDPTAPDIHLGHTVVFRKLKHFQDIGHQVFFLIGDFTARIGDPTGRDKTRPPLSEEQVIENAQTYLNQISKILDKDKTTVVYNSQWLKNLTFDEVIKLAAQSTLAKLLEHNTFKQRLDNEESVRMNELLYPFMQGFDSVALHADVELGGTDQTFNMMFGRDLQRFYGQEPQVCLTMPILTGTDGVQKMSKSLGNYIGIDEPASIMFEKIMRMHDSNIISYFTLLTDINMDKVKEYEIQLSSEATTEIILKIKKILAFEIVKIYHNEAIAQQSLDNYGKSVANDLPTFSIGSLPLKMKLVELVKNIFNLKSNNESRTLIMQGAVSIDGIKINDPEYIVELSIDRIIKAGKSKLIRLVN